VGDYSDNVRVNVDFLGERARELSQQEVDRARALDTKAGAMVAGCIALGAASVAFVIRLAALDGGTGAKTLWAVEVIGGLAALLFAGALAVGALSPRAVRSAVSFKEAEAWATARVLEADPIANRGALLRAAIHSVGMSRDVNRLKASRLKKASTTFAVALASVVALTVSVAVHAAMYPAGSKGGSEAKCSISAAVTPKTTEARKETTRPIWTIRCSPYPTSTSSSARD
jgi:hypothetical protein